MIWIKRLLKGLGAIIVLLLLLFVLAYIIYDQPIPKGKRKATMLTEKMQKAITQTA